MDNQLNQAFQLVSQHNSNIIKQGQLKLSHLRKNNFYPIGLLIYMSNHQNTQGQLRAAIQLKLWCQSYQAMEEFQKQFYLQVIQQIKEKIIFAYLNFTGKISQTLRPGIVNLTNVQFPRKWSGLMPGLVNYCTMPGNQSSLQSILLLIQDITHKYSYLSRSDPLYEQIILVCDQIHDFLLNMTMKIIQMQNLNDQTLQILQTLMKIFYHLNYQDLHPKFQDNLNNWMGILKTVMNFQNTSQNMFKCKGAALQSILLYASKYKQDVQQSIKGFSSEIWNLCSNATDDMEYDSIVFNCLKYFKSIILWAEMKQFFIDNMAQLVEKLIMPNLKIDKSKVQMFLEQPDTFVDFYFKNTQIHTRRAASLDLLRVICRNFPNFDSYVLNLIQNFNSSSSSVSDKCNLLNFIIDGACKNFRDIDGCSQTFININYVIQCYQHLIKPDLGDIYGWIMNNPDKFIEDQINLILLITLMRYIYYFRIFISPDNYQLIIKFVSSIKTNNFSIKTLIFMVTNAFLTVRHGDFQQFKNLKYYFNSENTHNIATDILQMIYINDKSFNMLNQNLTRMLYTLSKILSQSTVQYYNYFDALFKQMLVKTQQFDFKSVLFLFQSIGIVSYWISKSQNQQHKNLLQNQIFDYFNIALKRGSDLMNFCFQILAIFLQFQNQNVSRHITIYNSTLNPSNWIQQNISIMSSYIQYISSFLSRSHNNIINDLPKFSIIFSKLVELQHYQLFFRFLDSILKIINIDQFYQIGYLKITIHGIQAIMQKSIAGKKQSMLFIFKIMSNYDVTKVLSLINNISSNLFDNLINNSQEIIRTMQVRRDRKFMYNALCNAIMMGIFKPQMQGNLLSFLIDNTTNRFSMSSIRENISQKQISQKKQSTYQKLQVFTMLEQKQNVLQIDQQQQLCKAYILCQKQNRTSIQCLNDKNHDRMKRLIQKHQKNLQQFLM